MRLFIALDLPQDVRSRLAMVQGGLPGARWVAPESLHLTLRFIGDSTPDQAEDLVAGLSRLQVPPFDLCLQGLGVFGDRRRARMLWVGTSPTPGLRHLQAKVEQVVQVAGFGAEQRKFHPHVTIARLRDAPKGRLENFVADHGGIWLHPFAVTGFTLFRSHLGSERALYEPLVDFDLDQDDGDAAPVTP
ncbi:MAG: RNA 2',3'-cyclic phosphodiesterase [Minwuia sp.]|nr:RNA 2',3'-cyclic phosphodiesterase [Minwuia sp.]